MQRGTEGRMFILVWKLEDWKAVESDRWLKIEKKRKIDR
jgi:hypothetical protein